MTQQENELNLWGFTKPMNRNVISAIIVGQALAICFFIAKWQSAERERTRCYQETVEMEQRHSAEKEAILNKQLSQQFQIGLLTARVEQIKKVKK